MVNKPIQWEVKRMKTKHFAIAVISAFLLCTILASTPAQCQTNQLQVLDQNTFQETASATLKTDGVLYVTALLGTEYESYPAMWGITVQKPNGQVYTMTLSTVTLSQSLSNVTCSTLIQSDVKGTWNLAILVFAADGIIPLGVKEVSFTV
jgi:uncharacterized membrane protein